MVELKIILALLILIRASHLDWKYREIDDKSWLSLLVLGVVFMLFNLEELRAFIIAMSLAILLVAITYIPGLIGGGDGKILLGIAALFPLSPVYNTPFFVFGVFSNAVLISLPLPFFFFFKNLLRGDVERGEFIKMFLGYKIRADKVKEYEAVMRNKVFMNVKEVKLGERGSPEEMVWVTPAVPFLIPLTVGFLIAALYGDLFNHLFIVGFE